MGEKEQLQYVSRIKRTIGSHYFVIAYIALLLVYIGYFKQK